MSKYAIKRSIILFSIFILSACSNSNEDRVKGGRETGTGMFDYGDPNTITIYYGNNETINIIDKTVISELTLLCKEANAFSGLEKGIKVDSDCDIFVDFNNQRGIFSMLSTDMYGHLGQKTKIADMKISKELYDFVMNLITNQ